MKNLPVYPNENPIVQNMELRDYFAAQAMQAIIAKSPLSQTDDSNEKQTRVALGAYSYADAMLETRK